VQLYRHFSTRFHGVVLDHSNKQLVAASRSSTDRKRPIPTVSFLPHKTLHSGNDVSDCFSNTHLQFVHTFGKGGWNTFFGNYQKMFTCTKTDDGK
jgi:hypothetical protein